MPPKGRRFVSFSLLNEKQLNHLAYIGVHGTSGFLGSLHNLGMLR